MKIVSENRKAYHDYFIEDTLEAGIVLVGSEVKSIRAGKMNLKDSYVRILNNEAFLIGAHISTFDKTSSFIPDETRTRKLLLSRNEIDKLAKKIITKNYTLVPLKAYFSGNFVKIEVGLAKGKKEYEKKESIQKKDLERETQREIRSKI